MPSQDAAVEDREGRVILEGPRGKWTGCSFQKAEPTSVEDFTVGKAHNPLPMDPSVDCSLPFLRLLTGGGSRGPAPAASVLRTQSCCSEQWLLLIPHPLHVPVLKGREGGR